MKPLTRSICCAALLLLVCGICAGQAQTTNPIQTGAILEIRGIVSDGTRSQNVDLFITDSQIHTDPPVSRSPSNPPGTCGAADNITTDAYVLQGGSATGCDPFDAYETTQGTGSHRFTQAAGDTVPAYEFDVITQYCTTTPSEGQLFCPWTNEVGNACNSAGTVCTTGPSGPDTGFLTVSNNGSSTFTGTITLSGTSSGCGTVSDSSPVTLPPPDGEFVSSVRLALPSSPGGSGSESSNCGGFNSNITVGQTVPVQANGGTFQLLPATAPVTQSVTIPSGTTLGTIAAMRDVEELVDGNACDATVAGGSTGDPNFGGTTVSAGASCMRVSGNNAAILVNQCFRADGSQLPDCSQMVWNGTNLIGWTSNIDAAVDPSSFAYAVGHDNNSTAQLILNNARNVTTSFVPGCTSPPCSGSGGSKIGNAQYIMLNLNLSPPLSITSSLSSVSAGGFLPVTVKIQAVNLPTGYASFGLLSFTFEGPVRNSAGVCTPQNITIPTPPSPGGSATGFKVPLPAPGTNKSFAFNLPVPLNACTGPYKLSTTVYVPPAAPLTSGGIPFNSTLSFNVN